MFDRVPSLYDFITDQAWRDIHGEIGYLTLNSIVQSLSLDFQVVIFIMAILSLGFLFLSFKTYTKFYIIAFLIYFVRYLLLRDMGQIRQALASSLILFSFKYVVDRKPISFLVIVLIASSFHTIALIAIPFYIIYHMNFSERFMLTVLILSFVIGYFEMTSFLINNFSDFIYYRIVRYAQRESTGYVVGLFDPVIWFSIFSLILMIYFKDVLSRRINYYRLLKTSLWLAIVLRISLNDVAILAGD